MVDENEKERENDNEESCEAAASNETICHDIPLAPPEEIPVYCIATIENCPDSVVTEDYYHSIRRILALLNFNTSQVDHFGTTCTPTLYLLWCT